MKKQYFSIVLILFYTISSFAIDPPVLTAPENNATDQSTSPTIAWQVVTGAVSYEYHYSTDAYFTSFWNDYLAETTATLLNLNNNYTYYWRVRASDGSVNSDWSEVWSFTVEEASSGLAMPTLIIPTNNDTNVITTPSLLWNVVPSATEYEYQYSANNTFDSYVSDTTQSTAISIGVLAINTEYFWRVKATDGNEFSEWSEIWHFTTEGNTGVQEVEMAYFEVFPNPVNDILSIKSDFKMKSVSLVNLLGKEVYTTNLTHTKVFIYTSHLEEGIYFIKLNFEDKASVSKKIVVLH